MDNVKKVIEYRLHVAGLFGRNRKPKRDSVMLIEVPAAAPIPQVDLQEKVTSALATMRAKPGLRYQVIATEMTIKDEGTFTSRSFDIFSGQKVLEGMVA